MHQFTLSLLFILSIQFSFSQNIFSSDGYDMGPRIHFLEACSQDENGQIIIDYSAGYSSLDFCDCLADDLIPLLKKKHITYYISEGRQPEILEDPIFSKIVAQCILTAQTNWKQHSPPPSESTPPPPEEIAVNVATHSQNDTVVIKQIMDLVDYESKFYEILEDQLAELSSDSNITPKKIESMRSEISYDVINQPVIVNTYKEYSSEDLLVIYEYFKPMSSAQLTDTGVRYEQHILDYFTLKISILIKNELKPE